MADSMCGPSNALQSFQKHSSVDRTLQQDRLTGRASPSQGFRSSPHVAPGLINNDFEAFQAGQNLLEPVHRGFGQHASHQLTQSTSMGWANDFQRMNLSDPPAQLQHHQQRHQQQQRAAEDAWHQEFMRQTQQDGPSQTQYQPQQYNAPFERLSTIVPMQGNYQPQFGDGMMANQFQHQEQQPQMHTQVPVEAFDEEAFARAFDEAAQAEMVAREAALQKEEVLLEESAERLLERDPALDMDRIGADLIHDPDGKADQHRELQQDPDALSKTAAELLNRVRDNESEKFKNSQFLELMRQLRDKEVTVEGDKIVGVNEPDRHEPQA